MNIVIRHLKENYFDKRVRTVQKVRDLWRNRRAALSYDTRHWQGTDTDWTREGEVRGGAAWSAGVSSLIGRRATATATRARLGEAQRSVAEDEALRCVLRQIAIR